MLDNQSKAPYIFLTILAVTIIGGIWIFGFDDELFDTSYNTKSSWYGENKIKQEYQPISQDIQIIEKLDKEINHPDKISTISEESVESPRSETYVESPRSETYVESPRSEITTLTKPKVVKPLTKEELIKKLEKHNFILKGDGKGYQGTPTNSKPSSLSMTLTPIQGTSLNKFQIKTGKMIYGNFAINMEDGVMEISNNKVTITLAQDNHLDPIGTFTGSFSGSILDEKSKQHSVYFEKQSLYLAKESAVPIRFTLNLTFSYQ